MDPAGWICLGGRGFWLIAFIFTMQNQSLTLFHAAPVKAPEKCFVVFQRNVWFVQNEKYSLQDEEKEREKGPTGWPEMLL